MHGLLSLGKIAAKSLKLEKQLGPAKRANFLQETQSIVLQPLYHEPIDPRDI